MDLEATNHDLQLQQEQHVEAEKRLNGQLHSLKVSMAVRACMHACMRACVRVRARAHIVMDSMLCTGICRNKLV